MATPAPHDLRASLEWTKWKFGAMGHAGPALEHTNRCLREIAAYEHYFLTSKANLLGYLGRWDELRNLLSYLCERYPDDAVVMLEHAHLCIAEGKWQQGLDLLRRAERAVTRGQTWILEDIYGAKITCLVGLGKIGSAKREARRVLDKHRRFRVIRSDLVALQNGTYQNPKKIPA